VDVVWLSSGWDSMMMMCGSACNVVVCFDGTMCMCCGRMGGFGDGWNRMERLFVNR